MEGILKLLRSLGLSEPEIKKVLERVPVNPQGLAGTNVAKAIFEKGGKEVVADYPLVTETMISPFKLEKYKGLSKEDAIKKAEEAVQYLDQELSRTSNLVLNENLKLTKEQEINFANNLRMKRNFEKELEEFKAKPEAKVIPLNAKQPLQRNVEDALKEQGIAQLSYSRMEDEGLVRAAARQILMNDIKAGKIKNMSVSEVINMKEPLDPIRQMYGEGALEQLDSLIPEFRNLKTEMDAEKLARSKFKFEPDEARPKESYTKEEMDQILKNAPEANSPKGLDYLTGGEGTKELSLDDKVKLLEDKMNQIKEGGIDSLASHKDYIQSRLEHIDLLDPRKQNRNLDFQRGSLKTELKLINKAEDANIDYNTFEKLRQGLYGTNKEKTLNFIKTGKIKETPPMVTFEDVKDRYKTAANAHEEIFPNFNDPKTAANELAEVMAEQKYGKSYDDLTGDKQHALYSEAYNYITSVNRLPKRSPERVPAQVLENKMNEVLNQYDKSMFIKNEQGMVDVTHPENIAKMQELLRRDHPELYNQLQKLGTDLDQKEQLINFDIKDREPNAQGGIIRKKYGHEGIANPKKAQITAIYGEGSLPKEYSKGLGYLTGE